MSATLGDLADLVGATLDPADAAEIPVVDLSAHTSQVVPGALFACVRGSVVDGHDLAPEAVSAGARALVAQQHLDVAVPQLVVPDVRAVLGSLADEIHGHPSRSMSVVGVTGTNGKTTVVSMLASIFDAAGRTGASIGTLTGERTTPEAPELQRQLAAMRDRGVDAVAMEVSSHALDQHRVAAVDFDVAVFTNLGLDHLDYHGTQEAYFAAKAKLFDESVTAAAVVNVDDIHGRLLRDVAGAIVQGVSIDDAVAQQRSAQGTTFTWDGTELSVPMLGSHNVMNALLAAKAASMLGIDADAIAAGLARMPVVPGRFETFVLPSGATAVVDFAHTPDALESALAASLELAGERGKVTVVFGCGGDRDRSKRPLMGEVARRLADRVVVSSDNPRSEDPAEIAAAVVAGADGDVEVELDRATAIASGLDGAADGDVVLIAGKGHEQGQTVGSVVTPFDDREQVRDWIEQNGASR